MSVVVFAVQGIKGSDPVQHLPVSTQRGAFADALLQNGLRNKVVNAHRPRLRCDAADSSSICHFKEARDHINVKAAGIESIK
jgi:hypothetical protein